ncbi:hypothetical protein, partial [Mycolicibacterium elephantis]|uniref:hypothetical protein n=1 Tax=Mycolicibacterium elephantis TaxID=81858 RepID=UPI001A95FC77
RTQLGHRHLQPAPRHTSNIHSSTDKSIDSNFLTGSRYPSAADVERLSEAWSDRHERRFPAEEKTRLVAAVLAGQTTGAEAEQRSYRG